MPIESNEIVAFLGIKFGIRMKYAIKYMEEIADRFVCLFQLSPKKSPKGRKHHKTSEQRYNFTFSSAVFYGPTEKRQP